MSHLSESTGLDWNVHVRCVKFDLGMLLVMQMNREMHMASFGSDNKGEAPVLLPVQLLTVRGCVCDSFSVPLYSVQCIF